MSALAGAALREQLSAVMAALTQAAVAEVCRLVEQGAAALQAELGRSRRENTHLKEKLRLIESIVIRDAAAAAAAAAAADRPELPDVVLIKDEDSDCEGTFQGAGGGPGGEVAVAAAAAAAAAGEDASSPAAPQVTKRPWPGEEEEEGEEVQVLQAKAKVVYTLDSPRSEPGCSAHIDHVDAGEAGCCYGAQLDAGVHLMHQDCTPLPSMCGRPPPPAYFGGGGLPETQCSTSSGELDLNPAWSKMTKTSAPFLPFQQSEDVVDGDAFGLKVVSVSGATPSDCQLSEGSNSAFEYEDGDGVSLMFRDQAGAAMTTAAAPRGCNAAGKSRRFVCGVCNKTYATSQNLDVHMRIHTGERPFSCSQCGKKFTQSAHLKSHLIIHSGERPYACAVCSRTFIVKYSLKLHMKKCHPDA